MKNFLRLVKQGHQVIGVELSKQAIDDFFKEQGIPFEKEGFKIGEKDWYVYNVSSIPSWRTIITVCLHNCIK